MFTLLNILLKFQTLADHDQMIDLARMFTLLNILLKFQTLADHDQMMDWPGCSLY